MSVEVQHLSKRFAAGRYPAVDDVSFVAPEGAITALLGPSGAGKSTVLRLIAGLEHADQGTISLGGVDCTRLIAAKRGVGMVFQSYALFDHLSVRDNVAFGLSVRHVPKPERQDRVSDLLRTVQLEHLADRRPSQLSGGQRQRVAFARALAIRPRVLLLDEPFGALDARVRHELREWLLHLHAETQLTTVLVTHDQEEAFEVAQNVVVLFEGKVAQAGTPESVYDRPSSPAIASFIGGVNVFDGQVANRRATVGPVSVAMANGGGREGQHVQVLVRPHDVKLTRPDGGDSPQWIGRISAMRRVAGTVKLSIEVPGGGVVQVEASRADFDALLVGAGDEVAIGFDAAKVFPDGVEDYSI